MKKIIAVLLSVVILSLSSGVSAFAATTSGVERPRRVRIDASQKWVRANRSIHLEAAVYPEDYVYDKIEWYTLDYDLVEIDEYGSSCEVTGLKPGIANIVAYVYAESSTRLVKVGSAEIEIEVRGAVTSTYNSSDNDIDPDIRELSKLPTPSGSPSSVVKKKGTISTKAVNEDVKKALVAGTTKSATFKNYSSISTISLESAAAEMQLGGGAVLLNFDTLSADGKTTEGRLTINPRLYKRIKYDDPLQVGHSIDVTLNTNQDSTSKVRERFQKFFKNEIFVIQAGQKGGYDMNVTCRVKVGDTFFRAKKSDLRLYTYSPDKGQGGTYKLVNNPNISIDKNNNLSFTTNTGDFLIISDGKFTKRK